MAGAVKIISARGGKSKRDQIEKMFRGLDGVEIRVGFVGNSTVKRVRGKRGRARTNRQGTTVAAVAFWHEFGTPKMKARPFMRPAFADGLGAARRGILRAVRGAIKRGGPEAKPFLRMANGHVAAIQKAIRDVSAPPLRPSTLRNRFRQTGDRSPNPLIDTGQMIQSVSFIIERRGSRVASGRGVR